MRILILLSALLLIGCSTERRCARAVNRCAALWRHDTTYVHDSITIQRNTIDTVLRWNFLPVHDTVTIRDGRAVIRIVRLPGDSIWVQGECRDTVIRYVRQVVTKNVQTAPSWWVKPLAWAAGVAYFALGVLLIRPRR
ncbi:MAG: hypothetical protein ACK5XN_02265 [Bacteroidota bacterium]